ncbi:hypothetical protein F2P81_008448 [Scophthalmus maximus]|uniref:Uncharacterized protein n=1 Tax=Scophthalmus maximus TaxID=52904 RepID=A0A6A4T2C3_SCOMX|nr:hypothetical protein F2P81_008448 [Scophthalmus maximus]
MMTEERDAGVEALEVDLEQAKQDLACQALRVTEVTAELGMQTEEKESLSKTVEFLRAELEMVHTRGEEQGDQSEKLRETQQQQRPQKDKQCLDERKSSAAREAQLPRAKDSELDSEDVNEDLEREVARLSTSLEREIRKNALLSKMEKNLAAELRKEKSQILELTDQLQKQMDAQEQQLRRQQERRREQAARGSSGVMEAFLRELKVLRNSNLELHNKINAEKSASAALREQSDALWMRTQEMDISSNCRRLQAEKTKLEEELQNELQPPKAHRLEDLEASRATNRQLVGALQAEEERVGGLKAETASLSLRLEEETQKSACLSAQAQSLRTELQTEQTWRRRLSDRLQREKDAQQQEADALLQEVEDQRAANLHTLVRLRAEKEAGQRLRRETAELREELEVHMVACVTLSEATPSFWRRVLHFLGWRKKK